MVEFEVVEKENYTVVHFRLPSPISPTDLSLVISAAPVVPANKGVVISGRGPIWLHSALAHKYHPAKWVAHHDPRLGGAVVVESHTTEVNIGDIIKVEDIPTD